MQPVSPHFSKRTFLKQLSALAAAGFCTPFAGIAGYGRYGRNTPENKRKLGVALVGLGNYSTNLLAPALQLTKHCHLTGIVTGSPHKIPQWQRKYGIDDAHIYDYASIHRIADDDAIDVIYIVVPTGLHAKYAIAAAHTGKHVWCEKPMAMDVNECRQIIEACTKNKVRLSIGYRVQHEPNMQEIIRLTKARFYGEVTGLSAMAGYNGGVNDSWRFKKDLGGGALYDMGVYTINGLRHAGQMEPIGVLSATHSTTRPEHFTEVDETTEYRLEFPNGVTGYGKTSVGASFNRLDVTCADGSYYLAPMQTYNGLKGGRSDGVQIAFHVENQQARQMDNDALAIMNNTDVLVPGIDGLRDIRILEAIKKAAARGSYIPIE